MTSPNPDRDAANRATSVPWHHRTSAVLGASAAGLAAMAALVASVGYLTGWFAEPEQPPVDYVGPTTSATSTRTPAPTTTATKPPITSDINPHLTPTSTPSSTRAVEASTRNPQTTTRPPNYRPPRTRDNDDPAEQTTRGEPTRSLNPVP